MLEFKHSWHVTPGWSLLSLFNINSQADPASILSINKDETVSFSITHCEWDLLIVTRIRANSWVANLILQNAEA